MDEAEDVPADTPPTENPVLALLEEALSRAEEEGPAALERFCRDHPEHEAALRKRLDVLARSGLLPSAIDAGAFRSGPQRLGDFRLLERIGEGGMGVVYVAEQISLPRKVALKVVRPEQLHFGGARARFHREIDAIARLSHPGIVPIYAVGEQDGVPFYAMEHIAGVSLAEVLKDARAAPAASRNGAAFARLVRSASHASADDDASGNWLFEGSWSDVACRIVQQVAQALGHAHRRGVLHRDLKPSNIMVTGAGRVVLLDFGLASSNSAGAITKSGALLGSLPYMSPEQASGSNESIDARSDVYSLGATLYELLLLRVPFPQRETPALLQAIAIGSPPPPRTIDPSIPRDLETVCLTAMEIDPARRYASATDFARDLDNVESHRPIEARRVGLAGRSWRWMRRHPALAVAAAAILLLSILLPTLLLLLERQANRRIGASLSAETTAKKEAQEQRLAAIRQRDAANVNYRHAKAAIDQFLAKVGGQQLEDVPQMELLRRELLTEAAHFYRRLIEEGHEDPELRSDVADLGAKLALVELQLGERMRGEVEAQARVAELAEFLKDAPGDLDLLFSLARARSVLAFAHYERDRLLDAERSFRQAVDGFRFVAGQRSDDGTCERFLANAAGMLTLLLPRLGRDSEAIAWGDEAVVILARLVKTTPADVSSRFELGRVSCFLGTALLNEHRVDAAFAAFREAERALKECLRKKPGELEYRQYHAFAVTHLGRVDWIRDDDASALEKFQQGLSERTRLAAEFPATQGFRWDVAESRMLVGSALLKLGQVPQAKAELLRADSEYGALTSESPEHLGFRSEHAAARCWLAEIALLEGELELAIGLADVAIERQLGCLRVTPKDPACLRFLVRHQAVRAGALVALRRYEEALQALRSGLESSGDRKLELPSLAQACARGVREMQDDATLASESFEKWSEAFARLAIETLERWASVDPAAVERFVASETCDALSERDEFLEWRERSGK